MSNNNNKEDTSLNINYNNNVVQCFNAFQVNNKNKLACKKVILKQFPTAHFFWKTWPNLWKFN